jgi:signal transduction histidine kinase
LEEKLQTLEEHLKQLEEQLIRAQRLAALGTMATMIAHEFNNLLTPVVSYSQFALTQNDTELWHKALTQAHRHGQEAADVAQQILGFARGAGEGEGEQACVREVIESALKALVRDLRKDNIKLVLDLKPAVVRIAPRLLQQVLYNLIINARQAMLDRGGRLTLRSETVDGKVRISVADTGTGIAPEIMPKIFEPFFTTKSPADRPDREGTGLGLAVSKYITEHAGGSLTVESEPGKGACFTLTLPLA